MTARDTSAMLCLYEDKTCIGFLLKRNKLGVEAFDRDCVSLGLFPSESEAADAITAKARAAS